MTEALTPQTSGPVPFGPWYSFSEGGPVESGELPYVPGDAPFEIARWLVAPGTSNDLDVHVSREVWLVYEGEGDAAWGNQITRVRAGDVIAFDTKVPHQVTNDGDVPLKVFSIYWN